MVRMVRMVRSLADRTFQLWYHLDGSLPVGKEDPNAAAERRDDRDQRRDRDDRRRGDD